MSTLMYNPLGILDELFNMDNRIYRNMKARAAGRFPPVNVYLDENAVIVDVELPGRTAKDVSLTLEAQAVVIADKPAAPVEEGEKGEKAAEPPTPQWSRRLELPFHVNADKANAKFENGVLRIELPRTEAEGVRRIAIAE
ncbi:MAG: Hsp20/alpha crystallin family protein [Kiritimatiellia bacterium]